MAERDLFPFGYGRAWSEPKATGIRRLFQIGREPATTRTLGWLLVVCLLMWAAFAAGVMALRYAFA